MCFHNKLKKGFLGNEENFKMSSVFEFCSNCLNDVYVLFTNTINIV